MTQTCRAYDDVHSELTTTRGKASAHTCSCGRQALDGAYQYTDPGEKVCPQSGRRYGTVGHYAPMCRSCPTRFDLSSDAELLARRVAGCRKSGSLPKPWASTNIAAYHEAMRTDTTVKDFYREMMTKTNLRKRRCSCGEEANPGNLAIHQRTTGRTGYEEVVSNVR